MSDLPKDAVERFGHVVAVHGAWAAAEPAPALHRPDALCLRFEHGQLVVTAVAEDDTILLGQQIPGGLPVVLDLSGRDPWAEIVGMSIAWIWKMTNQQGYHDGFQAAFAESGRWQELQLMCEASSLTVRRVTPQE